METVNSLHLYLEELIFTNYLAFLLFLVLIYVIYSYLKIWPRIIVIKIIDYENGLFNIDNTETIKYFINGKEQGIRKNLFRKIILFGFLDKCEVSIEIKSKKGRSILKSEQKRMNRINYFDFYLSEEESKALRKDGGK